MFDWRESAASPVQDCEINIARVIHRRCGLSCDEDRYFFSQKNPVSKLSLQDFTLAVIFIVGQIRGLSLTTSWPLSCMRKIKDLHHLFTDAYYIFDDWPNNFYEFLNWWRTQGRNVVLGYQRLQSVLYKDFGKLYLGVYKTLSASQFVFIREAFIDYLIKVWNGCDLSSFAHNKNIGQYPKAKYVSKSDARRLLAADDQQINHFIQTGRLKTEVRSKGMKRLIFVQVVDIADVMREKAT
jgi:hypothetical protein